MNPHRGYFAGGLPYYAGNGAAPVLPPDLQSALQYYQQLAQTPTVLPAAPPPHHTGMYVGNGAMVPVLPCPPGPGGMAQHWDTNLNRCMPDIPAPPPLDPFPPTFEDWRHQHPSSTHTGWNLFEDVFNSADPFKMIDRGSRAAQRDLHREQWRGRHQDHPFAVQDVEGTFDPNRQGFFDPHHPHHPHHEDPRRFEEHRHHEERARQHFVGAAATLAQSAATQAQSAYDSASHPSATPTATQHAQAASSHAAHASQQTAAATAQPTAHGAAQAATSAAAATHAASAHAAAAHPASRGSAASQHAQTASMHANLATQHASHAVSHPSPMGRAEHAQRAQSHARAAEAHARGAHAAMRGDHHGSREAAFHAEREVGRRDGRDERFGRGRGFGDRWGGRAYGFGGRRWGGGYGHPAWAREIDPRWYSWNATCWRRGPYGCYVEQLAAPGGQVTYRVTPAGEQETIVLEPEEAQANTQFSAETGQDVPTAEDGKLPGSEQSGDGSQAPAAEDASTDTSADAGSDQVADAGDAGSDSNGNGDDTMTGWYMDFTDPWGNIDYSSPAAYDSHYTYPGYPMFGYSWW